MAKPVNYIWSGADDSFATNTSICGVQSTLQAGNLVLNGGSVDPTGHATFPKCNRYVSISSATDSTAILFTITGTYRNSTVSEVLPGPGPADTIVTAQLFSEITSIEVNGAVTDVSLGTYIPISPNSTSILGYTDWFTFDNYVPYFDAGFSVVVPDPVDDVVNYSLEGTMQNPLEVDPSITFSIDDSFTNQEDTLLGQLTIPIKGVRLVFYNQDSGNLPSLGRLTATILQQGLRS